MDDKNKIKLNVTSQAEMQR